MPVWFCSDEGCTFSSQLYHPMEEYSLLAGGHHPVGYQGHLDTGGPR